MEQQRIWDVITAVITVAIALPHEIARTAACAVALETLALVVDFPCGFNVEIPRNRDERHLVGIDCVTDGKEKRSFFDIV